MTRSDVPEIAVGWNQQNPAEVRVSALEEDRVSEWDSFVLAHRNGSFFHQTAWKRVMERTYRYRPYYFYAEREGQITGIAPVFLVSSYLTGRCMISLPFAVYGGICASDEQTERCLLRQLEEVARREGVEYLELRNRNGGLRPAYHAIPRYATFTMPLVADPQILYQAFPKDIRYMIRKGEKAGLSVRHGLEQLESFYRLMTLNLRRLGTPAFPRSLFENLIQEYPKQIDLAVVYSGSKPVAGGMTFLFRDSAQPYYVGSEEEAKITGANNFLWWQMIKHAAEAGRSEFDFGRSKNDSGNYAFKKKWNPCIQPLDYQLRLVRRKSIPNFSPTNPKFKIASNLWRRLPLGLTRVLGPRLVRCFP
jgi:FemAB-related protein (PEP-CTERM system-associated)